jgi:hypothetical protein
MQTFAHYALPGTILVGGLGAVILCLVLFVYGFRSDPDDEGLSPARRQLVIRLGHAAAAACFAAVVMLGTVALIEQRRAAAAPPRALLEVDRLQSEMHTLELRLAATELRLGDLTQQQRVALASTAESPARPVTAPASTTRPRKAATPPPRRVAASATTVDASASPPSLREPAETTPVPAPSARVTAMAPPPPPSSDDFGERARTDWESVKRGFRDAGNDVRAGFTDFGRRVKGLFTRDTN